MYIVIRSGPHSARAKGCVFTVIAVYFSQKMEVLINADWLPSVPLGVSLEDVEIIDNRGSRHWKYGCALPSTIFSNSRPAILAFREWVEDRSFFEKLVNGDISARSTYELRVSEMMIEFAHPAVLQRAVSINGNWIECCSCGHLFEYSEALDEMIRCPECMKIQLMPQSVAEHLNRG